jgi:hypothetical protein
MKQSASYLKKVWIMPPLAVVKWRIEKMNRSKIGILLAFLLALIAIIPCVSASVEFSSNQVKSEINIEQNSSNDQLMNFPEAKPLSKSDIYSFVFPEQWLSTYVDSKDPNLITLPAFDPESKETFPLNAEAEGYYVYNDIQKNERIILLNIPKTLYDYLKGYDKSSSLTIPASAFSTYANVDDMKQKVEEMNSKWRTTYLQNSLMESNRDISATDSMDGYQKRIMYHPYGMYSTAITMTYGHITPYSYTVSGNDRYRMYQERELYMDNANDAIELIAWDRDTSSGNGVLLYPRIWDNGYLTTWSDFTNQMGFINVGALPHTYEYYVGIGIGSNVGVYQIWFRDMNTMLWYWYRFDDDTVHGDRIRNPGTYIDRMAVSSELIPEGTFGTGHWVASTNPITDEYARADAYGVWIFPYNTWREDPPTEPQQYVRVSSEWGGYNNLQLITRAWCDYRLTTPG